MESESTLACITRREMTVSLEPALQWQATQAITTREHWISDSTSQAIPRRNACGALHSVCARFEVMSGFAAIMHS